MVTASAFAGTANYYYDELGRLVEAVAADGTSVQYAYDSVGNVTSVRHFSTAQVGLSGFVPASGTTGTTVTLFGSGFSATPSSNVVKFNGAAAAVTSATSTTLTVTVPGSATTGPVSVTNGASTATSTGKFTVAALAAPTLTGFTPTIGSAGTPVTLSGTNFQTDLETDRLVFGQMPARPSSASATSMTAPVPTPGASGKLGITTPYGTATTAADFFAAPPGYDAANVQFTGRLSNAPLVVSTTAAGKIGLVVFDGTAGQAGVYLGIQSMTMPGGTALLFTPDGSQLGSWNLANGLLSLPRLPVAGTYTLAVVPGGPGQVTLSDAGVLDLAISGLKVTSVSTTPANGYSIGVTYTVTNKGTIATPAAYSDSAYLSTSSTLGPDALVGVVLGAGRALAADESATITTSIAVPGTTPPGTYTLFVKTDGHAGSPSQYADSGELVESDETDNVATASVTFDADLQILNFRVSAPTAVSGLAWRFHVSYDVKNLGANTTVSPNWWDVAYLQSIPAFGSNVVYHADVNNNIQTALAPGQSYHVEQDVGTDDSVAAGSYVLFVKTDAHGCCETDTGNIVETDEANNLASAPLVLDADLQIQNLVAGVPVANSNDTWSVPIDFDVLNAGATTTAAANWWDVGFLQTSDTFGTGIVFHADVDQNGTTLAPGQKYHVHQLYTTDTSVPGGSYTLFVKADAHGCCWNDRGQIAETDEGNNVASVPVVLDTDLTVSNLTAGAATANSDGTWSIPVSFKVNNVGSKAAALPSWWDVGYLQASTAFGTDIVFHADLDEHTVGLSPGASYEVDTTFETDTSVPAGTYTLFVKADAHGCCAGDTGNIPEVNEANNVASAPVVLDADLVVSGLVVGPAAANPDGTWTVPVSFNVDNIGTKATAAADWWDVAYLQTSSTFGTGIVFHVDMDQNTTSLPPGKSYAVHTSFTTDGSVGAAAYTVFVKADAHGCCWNDSGQLAEANENNNAESSPLVLIRRAETK